MKNKSLYFAVALIILGLQVTVKCYAERLLPITFKGQPTLFLKNGNLHSCGVRFLGVEDMPESADIGQSVWVPDASFNIDKDGFGFVKAIINKATIGDVIKSKAPVAQTFKSFWIKAPNTKSTMPIKGGIYNGDNKNSKLYVTDFESVWGLYRAVLEGKPIQIGFSFNEDEFAFYGLVNLNEKELNEITACLTEISGQLRKDAEPNK